MPRYVATVASPRSPEDAFDFLADLRNFPAWDPGVKRAVQVRGDGPGPEAAYDLTIASNGSVMRYEVRAFGRPDRIVVESRTGLLHSIDEIRVQRDGEGSVVTYDATLSLSGWLSPLSFTVGPVFRRIGDAAAEGLRRALRGVAVKS